MKAGGTRIRPMAGADSFMQTETSMRATGSMIRLMVSECTVILTGLSTKDSGRKTNSTEMELRPGLMVRGMRVSTSRERSMAMEPSLGLMALSIRGNLSKTTSREKVLTTGQMEESTMEIG
jgi:hypothetical protein